METSITLIGTATPKLPRSGGLGAACTCARFFKDNKMKETAAHAADVSRDQQYDKLLATLNSSFAARTSGEQTRLYTTDTDGLFDVYLNTLSASPEGRQHHTCNACRRFIERFGGLVTIGEDGAPASVIWAPDPGAAADHPYYAPAIAQVRDSVERARVTGVFYTSESIWGLPRTGEWTHFSVTPGRHLIHQSRVQTAFQAMAEAREDYRTMITALQEITLATVETAVTLLKTDSLYRSEKCLGVAEWLRDLIVSRDAAKNSRVKENLLWRAVATAPAGFAHPRSSMIGTLLEDISAGLPFEDVKAKFAAKMHPLLYRRPQAAPSAGTIRQAEKVVEQMGIAPSLERRFARLDELQSLWMPHTSASVPSSGGVFGHLKSKNMKRANAPINASGGAITWEKFARTVLPEAESIEVYVPTGSANFAAYVTAQHADAPPILQWDREDRRNPVSWYLYVGGSMASKWGLVPGAWARVNAISAQPSSWHEPNDRHGAGVLFVIDGARDHRHEGAGNALFPECLRSELHGVRAVIEAYSRSASIAGVDEASACGLLLQKQSRYTPGHRVRVAAKGATLEYTIDRWD
ncbi:hypothetical protein WL77_11970 [Burkholderia ubonensis]|nr:hypothetical protein WK61_15385 [Burkholderia ubonensis]KWE70515.1 hypothetical protein WL77_11970 [Burkholderia ubonensis]KWE74860.1 hypothetical protein WL79_13660 [Burkholderia ubonensis]